MHNYEPKVQLVKDILKFYKDEKKNPEVYKDHNNKGVVFNALRTREFFIEKFRESKKQRKDSSLDPSLPLKPKGDKLEHYLDEHGCIAYDQIISTLHDFF